MKTFDEYREYLQHQLNHLIINNDQDLLSFTKLLLNYGKVASKFYAEDVAKLAHKYKIYGFKEHEFLEHIKEINFKDQNVIFKTKDRSYIYPLVSVSNTLASNQIEALDMFILLSISLDNRNQGLFQLINYKK